MREPLHFLYFKEAVSGKADSEVMLNPKDLKMEVKNLKYLF